MTYAPQQLANATAALEVVRLRGLDDITAQQVLAGMLTECTLWNYSNPIYPNTVPLGDGLPPVELAPSTKKSCGVFQQQPHVPAWWGPSLATEALQAAGFMNVHNATGYFLDALVQVPRTAQPWREIQAVQGSEYNGNGLPYAANYQGNWVEAGRLLTVLRFTSPGDPTPLGILEWISATERTML